MEQKGLVLAFVGLAKEKTGGGVGHRKVSRSGRKV
jgi:hypothetical protein